MGEGMQLGEQGTVEFSAGEVEYMAPLVSNGNVTIDSTGTLSLGPSSGASHTFEGKGLHSTGQLQLGVPATGGGRRRQLSEPALQAGDVVIGSGGLISTGPTALITVPQGSTMTFNSTDPVNIGGQGMDSAGAVSILQGDVLVSAGGIRSQGSINIEGGGLNFSSSQPSVIGGTGLTIKAGATATVAVGTVDFTAPFVGDLRRSGNAKIRIDTAVNQTCPSGWSEGCSVEVLIVEDDTAQSGAPAVGVLSTLVVTVGLAFLQW